MCNAVAIRCSPWMWEEDEVRSVTEGLDLVGGYKSIDTEIWRFGIQGAGLRRTWLWQRLVAGAAINIVEVVARWKLT